MPSDPYLGEITISAITFTPRGYLPCNGQILPIAQYSALYALLGTTYGGNGSVNFALPDLRSRVPIHVGQGTNLSAYALGQNGGTEGVTLTTQMIPSHTHTFQQNASNDAGDTASPGGAYPAFTGALDKEYKTTLTNPVLMNGGTTASAGNGLSHPNIQPYLTLNFYIAMEGLFPSQP